MYNVYAGNDLIHDDRLEGLRIIGGKLTLEVGKSGLFEFTIYPSHPRYDSVQPVKTIIQVLRDGENIFSGRVLSIRYGFYNEKIVKCEGELAYLLDSLIAPHIYSQSFSGYFSYIIEKHNAQVETHKRFTPGMVTVSDFTPFYVVENLEYKSAYDTLKTQMLDRSGGILRVRWENGVRYLDLIAPESDQGTIAKQEIRLKKNLLDMKREINGGDVFTAMVPLGAKIEGSEIRLDIKNVNAGLPYIVNEEARAAYGLIFRQVIFDKITDMATLKSEAEKYLTERFAAMSSIEITAADLSGTDEDLDGFLPGQWVRVYSPAHGIGRELYYIRKMTLLLDNPAATKIEIGMERKGLTDSLGAVSESVSKSVEAQAVQPHVTESGTKGIFQWEKYSDGTCSFFGKVPVSSYDVGTALGTWYKGANLYDAKAHPYPFQLAEAPAVTMTFVTRNGSGAFVWPFSDSIENVKAYLPQCYLVRPTTATGIYGYISIMGNGRL